MIEYQKQIHDYQIILQKLILNNFRLFDHIIIEIHPKLNVFIGIDGAGKTSVLDAIAKNLFYLIQTITRGNQDIDVYHETDIRNSEIGLSNNLEIILFHHQENLDSKISNSEIDVEEFEKMNDSDSQADEQNNEIKIVSAKNRKKLEPTNFENFDFLQNMVSQINKNIRLNHQLSVPVLLFFKTDFIEKENREKINIQKLHLLNTYDDSLENTFDLNMFFEWFKWQGNLEKTKKKNFTKTIQQAIYQMLSDEENKFSDLHVDYENAMQGELMIKKDDSLLKINQLSSGEKRIFVISANLAFRLNVANPEKENPLSGQGVVLIDEIDLHLHPQWQRKIISQLQKTFPNIQFIVTTHSPLVLQNVEKECVKVLAGGELHGTDSGTKGRSISALMWDFMKVGEFLPDYVQKIRNLDNKIDLEKFDEAKILLNELEVDFGPEDLLVLKYKTMLENFELLHK